AQMTSGSKLWSVTSFGDRLGELARRALAFDGNCQVGEVDPYAGLRVDALGGAFDRRHAMAAGHVGNVEVVHLLILHCWMAATMVFATVAGSRACRRRVRRMCIRLTP